MWKAITKLFTKPEVHVSEPNFSRRTDHEQVRRLLESVRERRNIQTNTRRNTDADRRNFQRIIDEVRTRREQAEQEMRRQEVDVQEHVRRAMSLEEFLNGDTDVARMRTAHRAQNVFYEEPEEPQELNLEELVNGGGTNLPLTDVIRAMALEIMTLRDEIGTLEERLETAEYYSEAS